MQQAVSRKSGQALGTLRFEEKSMGGGYLYSFGLRCSGVRGGNSSGEDDIGS